MSLKIIQELLKATPKKRSTILFEMRDKNLAFLAKRHRELSEFIAQIGTGSYKIEIDDDFLNIIDIRANQTCHPYGKLLQYSKDLGSWHHTAWIDKIKVYHQIPFGIEHGELLGQLVTKLHLKLPVITQRVGTGEVKLPILENKKRFSGVTVFLGIFTGLHILHYLETTEVKDIVLIEPDLERFAVSCFFLDYAAIERKLGHLLLHVGSDLPDNPQEIAISNAHVTATAWIRMLPAYPSQLFDSVINKFELKWRALSEIFVPFDREVRNLCYGAENLEKGLPVNFKSPTLSNNSCIVIVGSGPSLDTNIEWLKNNHSKVIIFAAHSAVRTLKKHGITPDYQCSLDTELDETLLDKLQLDYDVPFISYYKANYQSLKKFKKVFLVNEAGKANPVLFHYLLTNTHPTTGNLAVATAMFAKPKKIILIGLDLGFRDINQHHSKEYWAFADQKEKTEQQIQVETSILVDANFPESQGSVYTHAYHNNARHSVENALAVLAKLGTQILNFSDGAKIRYAEPCHSETFVLSDYPEKKTDIEMFEAAFSSERKEVWELYKNSGETVLNTLQTVMQKKLALKQFDWINISKLFDDVWMDVVRECVALQLGDLRIEAYGKLIQDLLVEWYRILIFTKTAKEANTAYRVGYEALNSVLQQLHWPQQLIEFEGKFSKDTTENIALKNEAFSYTTHIHNED